MVVLFTPTSTSRKLRQEFPEQVNKFYWKKVFWNESYFIASCGGVTISVLKKYIENQDTESMIHHWHS